MTEQQGKPKTIKRWWPLGASVVFLLANFPPAPAVLFSTGKAEFLGLKSAGLLTGVLSGLYLTNKPARLQPKRRAGIVIASLALLFFFLTVFYFSLLDDAENHLTISLLLFFVLNVLIGTLVFLVTPALALIRRILKGRT